VIFAPPRTRGAAIAAAFAAAGIVLGVVLLLRGYSTHVSFAAFLNYTLGAVLLVAALVLGYWAYAAATLRYELSSGALSIRWGFVEHVIPLSAVERIRSRRAYLQRPRTLCEHPRCRRTRRSLQAALRLRTRPSRRQSSGLTATIATIPVGCFSCGT
jgi:hypothetical protein